MVMRSVSLAGAACLALAAEAIMIPSTMSMPGLTVDSLSKDGENAGSKSPTEDVKALPLGADMLERLKDLHLGVSKPMPFSNDEDDVFWIQDSAEAEEPDDGDFSITVVPLTPDDFENSNSAGKNCPSGRSFSAAMCRFQNFVSSQINHAKPFVTGSRQPCPKKLAAMAKAKAEEVAKPPIKGGINKFWPHFHPHEAMPVASKPIWRGNHYFSELPKPDNVHDHHHHHHHHNRFQHILHAFCNGLRRFISGFVIPVLIGVAAGMTASLVGMCVGTLLAWLWIKFVRGGKRGNAGAIVIEEGCVVSDEKDGLLRVEPESDAAPPVYVEKE